MNGIEFRFIAYNAGGGAGYIIMDGVITPENIVEAVGSDLSYLGEYADDGRALILAYARQMDTHGLFTPNQRSRYIVAAAMW